MRELGQEEGVFWEAAGEYWGEKERERERERVLNLMFDP